MTPDTHRRGAAAFCERFGVEFPIVGAPMAFVAGGALAAAIADAGALGMIGGGYGDDAWIAQQLDIVGPDLVREGRVGVGLISWSADPSMVPRLAERGVRTFCISFGDPRPFVSAVQRIGGRVLCQVQSAAEAVAAARAGADAIVAQGTEAGGHGRDNDGVEHIARTAVAAVGRLGIPVLAAGGISTADDLRRAVSWGAAGVMVGTRMYATSESLDVDAAKRRLVSASTDDAVRTAVFDVVRGPAWPDDYDGRALRNALVDEWERSPEAIAADIDSVRARYRAATAAVDLDQRAVWAGAGVGRIRSITPARDVIAELATGLISDSPHTGCAHARPQPSEVFGTRPATDMR